MADHDNRYDKRHPQPRYMFPERHYIVCIEYTTQEGETKITRSNPTTKKAAYAKRREYQSQKKGLRCWVEKREEEPFSLKNG